MKDALILAAILAAVIAWGAAVTFAVAAAWLLGTVPAVVVGVGLVYGSLLAAIKWEKTR